MATQKREEIGIVFIGVGGLFMVACPLMLICQSFVWLRYGAWPEVSLAYVWYWTGWAMPQTDWAGVTKIIVWLFDCPLSGLMLATGGIVVGIGMGLGR